MDRQESHWTLDRRVNLAHIVATLAMAGTLAAYLIKQEARLVVLEEHRISQLARDVRQDQDMRDLRAEIAALFRDLRDELRLLRDDIKGRRQ